MIDLNECFCFACGVILCDTFNVMKESILTQTETNQGFYVACQSQTVTEN